MGFGGREFAVSCGLLERFAALEKNLGGLGVSGRDLGARPEPFGERLRERCVRAGGVLSGVGGTKWSMLRSARSKLRFTALLA